MAQTVSLRPPALQASVQRPRGHPGASCQPSTQESGVCEGPLYREAPVAGAQTLSLALPFLPRPAQYPAVSLSLSPILAFYVEFLQGIVKLESQFSRGLVLKMEIDTRQRLCSFPSKPPSAQGPLGRASHRHFEKQKQRPKT